MEQKQRGEGGGGGGVLRQRAADFDARQIGNSVSRRATMPVELDAGARGGLHRAGTQAGDMLHSSRLEMVPRIPANWSSSRETKG